MILIFLGASAAWVAFGGVMHGRTHEQSAKLRGSVGELWGEPQTQAAPALSLHWETEVVDVRTETRDGRSIEVREPRKVQNVLALSPASTRVDVGLTLDQRLKGLLWYSLYDVAFDGAWTYAHRSTQAGTLQIAFTFPDQNGLYDGFQFIVDGVERGQELRPAGGQLAFTRPVAQGDSVSLRIRYRSRGQDRWTYAASPEVASLEDFHLAMKTDFADIDFPAYSMSPSSRARSGGGWALSWDFARVVTGRNIGMVMPTRIQPGELASALSFSAPISLLFFFLLLLVLASLRKIDIHPMNYLFLAGGFFAFHLLFGYSVDRLPLVPAFVLASAVSIALVVSYLRLVVSSRFAFVEAALGQLVYLVGFSVAHFFDGYTGLTVTVLSIATLFLLMQLTGRVKWSEVLAPRQPKARPAATT